ncbi:MAG TPA: extracellular solute-binding protein [Thermoleophilia bacterium]|nr:extracellular solute-binding protein [Thermoleophilia bacterium]
MSTKRHRLAILILAAVLVGALALVLAACGGDEETTAPSPSTSATPEPEEISGKLTVFAYEDGFVPEYLAGFYLKYPNVDLKASAYEDGDAAIAKMRAGFDADVINLCVEENAERAVKLGLVVPLDVNRLTHWDEMFPVFLDLPGVTSGDGQHYMAPVDAGVTGIAYDSTKVTETPTSFMDLFDPKYEGQVAMIDYPVTAIQVGALALGYEDPINLSAEQLENVKNLYIEAKQRGQFRTFFSNDSEIVSLFHTGEISLGVGYPSNAANAQREGDPVEFTTCEEGQIVWTCGYGISSTCKNVDAAYALVDYYLSPEAQAFEVTEWDYLPTLTTTIPLLPEDKVEDASIVKTWTNIVPAAPPLEGYDAWIRAWQEVKRS